MIKLLLLILLCTLGYYLIRSLRPGPPSVRGKPRHDASHIDPARVVDAQFEDVEQGGPLP